MRPVAICGAALTALIAAPAAVASQVDVRAREAYFRVTVAGVQTTKWTADHKPMFRCDSAYTGQGTERVTFTSKRAVLVRAFRLGKGPAYLIANGDMPAVLPTRGWVKRQGTETSPPPTEACAVGDGGDGTYTPPPPDCGRKRIRSLKLGLAYDALEPNRITVSAAEFPTKPRFEQCPLHGEGWTSILSRDDKHRTAGQTLPRADLFDRSQGKILVLGEGRVHSSSDGVESTTRIQWTLTLTRVRHR